MAFEDLGLSPPIVRALTAEGYRTPTPIQSQAIPPALAGRDVMGCAQTGTGKTAAFALPLLARLDANRRAAASHRPRALVLSPTRELAAQIADNFQTYGRNLRFRHTVVFGGVSQNPQVRALRRGVHVLIATPGRLLDLMGQGHVRLDGLETFVLDEADRMLDMGFLPDLKRIVAELPQQRQSLFFSATMPNQIAGLAKTLLTDPVRVNTAPPAATVELIEQRVMMVERRHKTSLLCRIIERSQGDRTLVFTRTKHGADKVARQLARQGVEADAIHGDKSQRARDRALLRFRDGRIGVLVATDVAARGIDVDGIGHVVNYDLPVDPDAYVHRIGRTGRAGARGVAVSFCDASERKALRAIERHVRRSLKVDVDHDWHVVGAEPGQKKRAGSWRPRGKQAASRRGKPAVARQDARRPVAAKPNRRKRRRSPQKHKAHVG